MKCYVFTHLPTAWPVFDASTMWQMSYGFYVSQCMCLARTLYPVMTIKMGMQVQRVNC